MDMHIFAFDIFGGGNKHTLIPTPQASTGGVFMNKGSRDIMF